MSTTDEVSGVFDAIDQEVTAHDPVEEVSTEAVAEGSESTTETEEVTQTEEEAPQSEAAPVEGQANSETEATETTEHSQEESTNDDFDNWEETLPAAPQPYQGPEPELDENGQITNMTPAEYSNYLVEKAKAGIREEAYAATIENRALDIAEQILPSIKTNPAVRQMVENARVAAILNGKNISTVDAAKQVREALGIAPEQITAAKNEGARNAKVSIETQKNSALETGSSHTQEEDPTSDLVKRVQRGDDNAFADLLGLWEETGKI